MRQLDVKGATIILGAMGCQKKVAQEIHFAGGDYVLALKANHSILHGGVMASLPTRKPWNTARPREQK